MALKAVDGTGQAKLLVESSWGGDLQQRRGSLGREVRPAPPLPGCTWDPRTLTWPCTPIPFSQGRGSQADLHSVYLLSWHPKFKNQDLRVLTRKHESKKARTEMSQEGDISSWFDHPATGWSLCAAGAGPGEHGRRQAGWLGGWAGLGSSWWRRPGEATGRTTTLLSHGHVDGS